MGLSRRMGNKNRTELVNKYMKLKIVIEDARFLKTYKVILNAIRDSKHPDYIEHSKNEALALKITNALWKFEVD